MRLEVAGSGVREVAAVVVGLVACGGRDYIGEKVEELQREQDSRDSYLGTADSSVNQLHRATFYA